MKWLCLGGVAIVGIVVGIIGWAHWKDAAPVRKEKWRKSLFDALGRKR